MKVHPDSAKIGFPPPLIYLGILLLGFAWTGLTGRLGPAGTLSIWTGGAFSADGRGRDHRAGSERFRSMGTEVKPWLPATHLVTTGIYRFTRNPMYLGMAILYAGLAILFDSFTALLLLPVAILLIRTQVIAREERYLLGKFGAEYVAVQEERSPLVLVFAACASSSSRFARRYISTRCTTNRPSASTTRVSVSIATFRCSALLPARAAKRSPTIPKQEGNAGQRCLLVELMCLRIDRDPHGLAALPPERRANRQRHRAEQPSDRRRRISHQHPGADEQVDRRKYPKPLDPERPKPGQAPRAKGEDQDEDRGRDRILDPALRLAGMNLHPCPHSVSRQPAADSDAP